MTRYAALRSEARSVIESIDDRKAAPTKNCMSNRVSAQMPISAPEVDQRAGRFYMPVVLPTVTGTRANVA